MAFLDSEAFLCATPASGESCRNCSAVSQGAVVLFGSVGALSVYFLASFCPVLTCQVCKSTLHSHKQYTIGLLKKMPLCSYCDFARPLVAGRWNWHKNGLTLGFTNELVFTQCLQHWGSQHTTPLLAIGISGNFSNFLGIPLGELPWFPSNAMHFVAGDYV